MYTILLAAQAAAQNGGGFGNMIFMLVAVSVVMWLFMIRPQQKRQKKIREFQNSLQEGSKVVVGGGIYGTVKSLDQVKGTVDVEISRGVVITVDKGFVYQDATQQQPNAYNKANYTNRQKLLVGICRQGVSDFSFLSRFKWNLLVNEDP